LTSTNSTARTALTAAAKKRSHEIAEIESTATKASVGVHGIASHVEHLALFWIGQNFVRRRDFFKAFLCRRVRIHVWMQLARKFAVGLFDVICRCIFGDT
jgi:hypothetical protein